MTPPPFQDPSPRPVPSGNDVGTKRAMTKEEVRAAVMESLLDGVDTRTTLPLEELMAANTSIEKFMNLFGGEDVVNGVPFQDPSPRPVPSGDHVDTRATVPLLEEPTAPDMEKLFERFGTEELVNDVFALNMDEDEFRSYMDRFRKRHVGTSATLSVPSTIPTTPTIDVANMSEDEVNQFVANMSEDQFNQLEERMAKRRKKGDDEGEEKKKAA